MQRGGGGEGDTRGMRTCKASVFAVWGGRGHIIIHKISPALTSPQPEIRLQSARLSVAATATQYRRHTSPTREAAILKRRAGRHEGKDPVDVLALVLEDLGGFSQEHEGELLHLHVGEAHTLPLGPMRRACVCVCAGVCARMSQLLGPCPHEHPHSHPHTHTHEL